MEEKNNNSIEDIIYRGIHANLKFSDGSEVEGDWSDLFERADQLASLYGIGNHKSFSSFVKMVNKEDPVIINGLLLAATKRIKETYGIKDKNFKEIKNENSIFNKNKFPTKFSSNKFKNNECAINNRSGLSKFLRDFGADKQELQDVEAKIKSGKIKIPDEDFDWITSDVILKENFNLKKVLKDMKKAREKTYNINVSLDTLQSRGRK